jgi:hypothetical protein
LELPPREVRHQLWPGARRATTKRLVGRPFAARSFLKPSAAVLLRFHTPRGYPLGTLRLRALTTSGQQGCPRNVGLSAAGSSFFQAFALPRIKKSGPEQVPSRPSCHASTSARRPLGLPPRTTSLELGSAFKYWSSPGPTEQAACATSRRSSCSDPAVSRLRTCYGSGLPPRRSGSPP